MLILLGGTSPKGQICAHYTKYRGANSNIHKDGLAKKRLLNVRTAYQGYYQAVCNEALMHCFQEEYNDMVRDYPYLLTCDLKLSCIHSGTMAVRDARSNYSRIDFDMDIAAVTNCLQFRTLSKKSKMDIISTNVLYHENMMISERLMELGMYLKVMSRGKLPQSLPPWNLIP